MELDYLRCFVFQTNLIVGVHSFIVNFWQNFHLSMLNLIFLFVALEISYSIKTSYK